MKLIRFKKRADKIGTIRKTDFIEKVGILCSDGVKELSCSMMDVFKTSNVEQYLKDDQKLDLNGIKLLPPVKPSKVVCVGLNYKDHARELNMEIPEEPILFIKPPTTVIGHLDSIIYPKSSKQVDYEAELAVVLSRKAHFVEEKNASSYIAGYTILNDITARDLQGKDIQWTRAKSFDTFCPLGPCIETDLNPNDQKISLKLNHETKQSSNTDNMIFNPHRLIEFISNIMTLHPGDVIATGTPPGVGPMKDGDKVAVEVEDIGVLRNFIKKLK